MFSWKTIISANFCSCMLIILLFHPYNSTSALQIIEITFFLDFMLFEYLDDILGTQVECNFVGSFDLVFDLDDSHVHKTCSHGSSRLVCSRFVGCC